MRFIGITGGVGAGKTMVLSFIKKHYSCEIYLADEVAHFVYEPGNPGYDEMISLLGNQIFITKDEPEWKEEYETAQALPISRRKVSDFLFQSPDYLKQVNEIIHPAVVKILLDQYKIAKEQNKVELFFVEAALLIENGFKDYVDEMWYIYAPREVRICRLMKNRGYTLEKAEAIIQKQLSEEEFFENCDFVIRNTDNAEDTYRQIMNKLEDFSWQD